MEKWIAPAGNGVLEGRRVAERWSVAKDFTRAFETLRACLDFDVDLSRRKLLRVIQSGRPVGVKTKRLLSIPYIFVFIIRKEMQNRADKRKERSVF